MDKKSKVLFTLLLILVICSVYATYKRTMIDNDFYKEKSEIEVSESLGDVVIPAQNY
jgi:hypothetical protein